MKAFTATQYGALALILTLGVSTAAHAYVSGAELTSIRTHSRQEIALPPKKAPAMTMTEKRGRLAFLNIFRYFRHQPKPQPTDQAITAPTVQAK